MLMPTSETMQGCWRECKVLDSWRNSAKLRQAFADWRCFTMVSKTMQRERQGTVKVKKKKKKKKEPWLHKCSNYCIFISFLKKHKPQICLQICRTLPNILFFPWQFTFCQVTTQYGKIDKANIQLKALSVRAADRGQQGNLVPPWPIRGYFTQLGKGLLRDVNPYHPDHH